MSAPVLTTYMYQCFSARGGGAYARNETAKKSVEPIQERSCPDERALKVVESALTSELLVKYKSAYFSGGVVHDSMFPTWNTIFRIFQTTLALKNN